MLFNSIEFALFLPIVFFLYWFVVNRNLQLQNLLIVVSSFIFYGWWDWRFLSLLVLSSVVDFMAGVMLGKTAEKRSRLLLLIISLSLNLGLLGFFKYYNFFVSSFVDAFTFFGYRPDVYTMSIVLPVGISFYTFQSMSYTIDVYRRNLEPTRDIVAFFAFVSFFPQLVAGPIERATHLLPQFYKERTFDYAKAADGMRQILWGLFKKIVVADNCATVVNTLFQNPDDQPGSTLLLGAVLFAFQIYGDFSGYSDIALGTSKLFGFSLMRNFAFPYFSRDIAEFWRRWHISLSTWFRDYVYIPLGGSKGSLFNKLRNTFVIFIVSGFWHGANWTFLVWGFLHALYFIPLQVFGSNRKNIAIVAHDSALPSLKEFVSMVGTFLLVVLAWIFFRAESLSQAILILEKIFSPSLLVFPKNISPEVFIYVGILIISEWIGRRKEHPLQFDPETRLNRPVRWAIYYTILLAIFLFGGQQTEFIYFQF
jgi:alginate O-acetyltransferase complex protein AlgI